MLKAFKYRLYPNKTQEMMLAQHFGCVRWVFNWGLNKRKDAYETSKISLSNNILSKELTSIKKSPDTLWLNDVYSQCLQASLRNLDTAYNNFFKLKKGYPKFKSKHDKLSFQYPQGVSVDWNNRIVKLPKIGDVKAVFSRTFKGKIKTVTVSKVPSGKYYVSILVQTKNIIPLRVPIKEETTIGIDVGLIDFATFSTGEKIKNPKHLKKSLKKLKYLQYKHSKKQKKGKNREKSRLKLARKHEQITNQRLDFLHQLSTRIIRENQTICVENLNITGMLKNHKLARAISDVSWAKFLTMLEYKCLKERKNFLKIGRFEPSSKMCSCGKINNELTLSDRFWTCKCGLEHDRDILAAKNIKKFALNSL